MPRVPTERDWKRIHLAERRMLDLARVPIVARDIEIGGERFHYLETGDPALPPLVLIHGRGSASAFWYPSLPSLAPHRHCIAIDLRGWGLGSREPFIGTTGEEVIQWWRDGILRVIDALGIASFDLLGHSLGGMVSFAIALARPGRLRRLALEDPAGFGGNVPLLAKWYFLLGPERLASLAPRWLFDRANRVAIPIPALSSQERQIVDSFSQTLATFPGTTASGAHAVNIILGEGFTMQPRLSGIHTPTRIFRGERDPLVTQAIVERGMRDLRYADLFLIPEAGHSPHMEQPAAFTRAVMTFLEG